MIESRRGSGGVRAPGLRAPTPALSLQLVELKNGETYNGHLVSCDNWMNINLREVICTSRVSGVQGEAQGVSSMQHAPQGSPGFCPQPGGGGEGFLGHAL